MPSESMKAAVKALVLAQAFPTTNSIGTAQAKATLALAEEVAESNRLALGSFRQSLIGNFLSYTSLLVQAGDADAAAQVNAVKEFMTNEWDPKQAAAAPGDEDDALIRDEEKSSAGNESEAD